MNCSHKILYLGDYECMDFFCKGNDHLARFTEASFLTTAVPILPQMLLGHKTTNKEANQILVTSVISCPISGLVGVAE